MTNDKADFTQGSILKKLVAFMMPILGALILQAAYGAVDLLVAIHSRLSIVARKRGKNNYYKNVKSEFYLFL